MKKDQIELGKIYEVRINGVTCAVRIINTHWKGGWLGVELRSGKTYHLSNRRITKELCPGAVHALSK